MVDDFELMFCSADLACRSNPCRNGAKCDNINGGFVCQCSAGWTGIVCDISKYICGNLLSCES